MSMVSRNGATPRSSSKKQSSISNFFTKSSPPPNHDQPAPAAATPAQEDSLFASDDEQIIQPPRIGKPAKRKSGDIEVATDNAEEDILPERKRQRSNGTLQPIDANGSKQSKDSDRTSRFVFSSSPRVEAGQHGEEDGTLSQNDKDQLHQKFVKKLGRPDSISLIKRKNHFIEEPDGGSGAEEEGDSEEESAASVKRKTAAMKKGGSKLTPMEKQVLEIKAKHPDTLLVVEVGYKFRFFGEDARSAAKELSIVCIPGKFRYDEHPSEAHLDRFASASIPVHRLHVHVKRLVNAGHKVGVVRQLETAALKAAGDNRNAPFVRKLTNLYTKGTYIDDAEGLDSPSEPSAGSAPATGFLLCLTETKAKGWGTDEKVLVGIVAVQPATGDVVYDEFEDGFMRSEMETRLLHIAPCEFFIVGELSKASEKLVQHLSASKTNVFGDKARVERVDRPKTMAATAYSHVSDFYAKKMTPSSTEEDEKANLLLDKVLKLSENVTVCLSALIKHMSDYGLEHVFDLTKYFQSFSARSHMLLNGTTLSSLEIYQNQTDHSEKGSLFWALNRTKTRFGKRLLRKWVGRPLLDRAQLEERLAAVDELKNNDQPVVTEKLKQLLSRVKTDLEKSLIRIYYGKCTRPELLSVLQTMQRISSEFSTVKSPSEVGFSSSVLNTAVAALPTIYEDVIQFLDKINERAAKDDDKYGFFRDSEETEPIVNHKLGIVSVEHELSEHLSVAATTLKKKKAEYVTVAGIEYLIEVDNTALKNVPASWVKISGTKKVSRFHTPQAIRLIRERDQHKESLAAACDAAFLSLLQEVSARYQALRDCVQALAQLDCLLSLAEVAAQPGYARPEFVSEPCIAISQGRHPMVEQLLLDAYVPNDTHLAGAATRALLVTGPNMGGKSSYVRQVALLCIMAQVGSYVPASSAKLGLLDAVFTRMGAFDNMMAGESTFMVELGETAEVLRQATPRSLVILDELGRGTSTHDGVAIAHAVLDFVVRDKQCLCLFITHYQHLAAMATAFEGGELQNVHMRFEETGSNAEDITFLYQVGEGMAHRSYGLNVARLANIPSDVLEVAAVKSKEMEDMARAKRLKALVSSLGSVLEDSTPEMLQELVAGVEEL